MQTVITHIAHIRTDYKEKFGIPRQSGRVTSSLQRIVFEPEYRHPDALREIEGFDYLWLIFEFSEARRDVWSPTVRPPRLGGNRRVGVFASRSPYRPNSLGLSSVKLERVERTESEGTVLVVSGADLLDGTPIYDVKPYLPFSDSHPHARGGYAEEGVNHVLRVDIAEDILSRIALEHRQPIVDSLAEDPRPSYQDDDRVYSMRYSVYDVHFRVDGDTLTVVDVDVVK